MSTPLASVRLAVAMASFRSGIEGVGVGWAPFTKSDGGGRPGRRVGHAKWLSGGDDGVYGDAGGAHGTRMGRCARPQSLGGIGPTCLAVASATRYRELSMGYFLEHDSQPDLITSSYIHFAPVRVPQRSIGTDQSGSAVVPMRQGRRGATFGLFLTLYVPHTPLYTPPYHLLVTLYGSPSPHPATARWCMGYPGRR